MIGEPLVTLDCQLMLITLPTTVKIGAAAGAFGTEPQSTLIGAL
jgi:hypothetical protein